MSIGEKLYQLMDSFLVETDPPRKIEQLNQDRHLFIDNLLSFIADKVVPEEDYRCFTEEEMAKYCDAFQKGYNQCRKKILQRLGR